MVQFFPSTTHNNGDRSLFCKATTIMAEFDRKFLDASEQNRIIAGR